MTKGETIEYAIKKKCQEYSLVEWCEDWNITVDELKQFLTFGRTVFDWIEKRSTINHKEDLGLPKCCSSCAFATDTEDCYICKLKEEPKKIDYNIAYADRPDWCPRNKHKLY